MGRLEHRADSIIRLLDRTMGKLPQQRYLNFTRPETLPSIRSHLSPHATALYLSEASQKCADHELGEVISTKSLANQKLGGFLIGT